MSEFLLNEVCELIVDCPHSTAKDEGKGYPLVRTPNIGKGRLVYNGMHRVCEDVYNKRNARAVPQENDLIFAREATAGNVALIQKGEKVCLGQRTVLIRPNQEKVNPAFLTYFLLAPKQQYNLLSTANGATVAHVNLPAIRNLKIDLPELPIQHRIATILSRYDSLIENYQKQIKLLEEAAQRLYKEWFVDLHFPGHENVKIVDGVPEGWEKKKVGDFVTFYDKQRKPLSSMQRMNMEKIYPYYGAASLMDYVDNYLFDGIYLLFGEDGTVITPDNHPVLQYVWGKFWVNNHAHVLRGKDRISTEFLYVLFRNITISDVVTGAAQPKISQGRLSEKMAMLPPITLIEKWSSIAGTYFFQLRNLSSQIRLLTEARDRLLPKLMSGEIEI
jgi:type I restriction enzyme S subunit